MPYGMDSAARSIKGMVQHLKNGGRLACPPTPHGPTLYDVMLIMTGMLLFVYCSYPMMTSCWAADKDERPSFSELAEMLASQLSDLLPQETL